MSIDGVWRGVVGFRLGFGYLWGFYGMSVSCGNRYLSSFVERNIFHSFYTSCHSMKEGSFHKTLQPR